jgi:hypothetical protein
MLLQNVNEYLAVFTASNPLIVLLIEITVTSSELTHIKYNFTLLLCMWWGNLASFNKGRTHIHGVLGTGC